MANPQISILINAKDKATGVFQKLKANAAKAGIAIAGYFGVRFFASATEDAQALEAQIGTLEAVIKSTGQAAGLTADEIVQMSKRLDEQTLGSAESFRKASTSLLTFKSVGKDVFETTLSLAQDLSSAGFGTLETNAIQLGKALEDPVKGLNSLTRSGVTFTQSEKELIKTLVETGDKAKAQGIILDALTAQVGGAGAGAGGGLAGAVDLVGKRMQDFKEQLGSGMLEPLTKVNEIIAEFIQKLNNTGVAKAFGEFIGSSFTFAVEKAQVLSDKISSIYTILSETGVINAFKEHFITTFDAIVSAADSVYTVIADIFDVLVNSPAINQFQLAFNSALETINSVAVQLKDAFISLYETLSDTTSSLTFGDVLGGILTKLIESVTFLVSAFSTGLTTIETAFHSLVGVGQSFFSSIMTGIAEFQTAMSKITFGDISQRWQEEAEKSKKASEEFAQAMTESFAKSEAALEKTAINAEKTRKAFTALTTETKTTANATDGLAQKQSVVSEAMGKTSESMHRLELSTVEVAKASDSAANSANTLEQSVDGVSKTTNVAVTDGIKFAATLANVTSNADKAVESLSNYEKSLITASKQQEFFNNVLRQEAAAHAEAAAAEEAKQEARDAREENRQASKFREFSDDIQSAYAELSPESLQKLEDAILVSNERRAKSGGQFGGLDNEALVKSLLDQQKSAEAAAARQLESLKTINTTMQRSGNVTVNIDGREIAASVARAGTTAR